METQRLISVSLGKIAQSRSQRGGINLHKNLLVATVLHKARTAYMMESYSYQQALQRQKLQQEQLQQASSTPSAETNNGGENLKSTEPDLGHVSATPTASERTAPDQPSSCESESHEPMSVHEPEVSCDKENSPPESSHSSTTKFDTSNSHLAASNQLSQEAMSTLNTTNKCNILKRRRCSRSSCSQEYECPVNKKPRVTIDSSITHTDSSDESNSEMPESPQITNLVSIFNSGFSGLCAISNDAETNQPSSHQSDPDTSNDQPQFTPLNILRPDSPSVFSRIVPETSLLCSTQVSRLESLPSAIVLSA